MLNLNSQLFAYVWKIERRYTVQQTLMRAGGAHARTPVVWFAGVRAHFIARTRNGILYVVGQGCNPSGDFLFKVVPPQKKLEPQ